VAVNSPGKVWLVGLEYATGLLLEDTQRQWVHADPLTLPAYQSAD
jgi:hypothetical protein